MIEDGMGGALKNLTDAGVLGSAVFFLMLLCVAIYKVMRSFLDEAKAELKAEREAHQATRSSQIEDLRNLAHVANSVDGMRTALTELLAKRAS